MREDWIETEIGDVAHLYQPKTISAKMLVTNGRYPVYGANGIIGKYDSYNHEEEELLITCRGATCGNVHITQSFSWINGNAMVVKPFKKDLLSLEYLKLVFSNKGRTQKAISGSAQPQITRTTLSPINIPLAPLPEQRAIVAKIEELFSDLDKGIDDLKKAKEQLTIYRQAVLKKAFEGELTKEWREKQNNLPTADELLEQIKEEREIHYKQQIEDWKKAVKDWEKNGEKGKKPAKPKSLKALNSLKFDDLKNLASIPEEWKYHYLAYAGDLGRGKSKHRPRNDKRLFGGPYPFFQTSEVKAQEIITEYTQTYSEFGLKQSKLWPAGTLCITIAANIAETGFLGIDACFPDSIVGYTPYERIIDIKYIDYFFQSAKRKISAYAPATAQKNINLTTLENLLIPYCSKIEQGQVVKEIESRLSICEKVEQSINESLEKAKALRQSILKKAFEGKLLSASEIARCKQEKDYEPASVLLEKIKSEKKKK